MAEQRTKKRGSNSTIAFSLSFTLSRLTAIRHVLLLRYRVSHTHSAQRTRSKDRARTSWVGKHPPPPLFLVLLCYGAAVVAAACSRFSGVPARWRVGGGWWRIRSGREGMERTEKVGRDIQEKITINLSRAPTRHHFFGTSWRGKIRFSTTRTRWGRVRSGGGVGKGNRVTI